MDYSTEKTSKILKDFEIFAYEVSKKIVNLLYLERPICIYPIIEILKYAKECMEHGHETRGGNNTP